MLNDFKKFISRGNVIDMAVGVIIGGAFGKIVTSLVNDIIMPTVGIVMGGVDFSTLATKPMPSLSGGEPITINYGMFIQQIVDFFIIALSVFFVVKVIERLKRKKKEEPAPDPAPAEPSKEEVLLTEIRDLLKEKK